jgi:murein DD-endopeptidase MepM/ murein hydrolase activator NlpD
LTGKKQSGTVKRSSHTRRSFLKRTFTQKVKHVPSCAADSFDALLKLSVGKHSVGAVVPTEVNRRTRTSAAMIGLAISMGAAGLLLPQQGDEAMAVEPVAAEPNLPTLPLEPSADPSASVAPAQAVEPGVVAVSTPSMPVQPKAVTDFKPTPPPVVEHQVQQGETLWQLSKSYEVQPEAIAASNKIQPSAILPVGQKLKIPSVNGIVHEVKAGETVETLSESYGVKPTQLQASAPVSESSQLQTGESVTVPGNVNDLLKVRQEVALNNLKEHGNRINDSLAELRSEESTNLSKQETTPSSVASAAEQVTPVTLPPAVLKPEDSGTNAGKPGMSVLTSPVVIPVPTPEIAATPAIEPKAATPPEQSVVIPVPTPEIAATPAVEPKAAKLPEPSVVLPVPTPEIAATPAVEPKAAKLPEPSVVLPVPTPEIAATPAVEPKAPTVSTLGIGSVTTPQTPGKPQVPQPVVMQTLVSGSSANVYQVKPGDTLDAIARRNGISSSQLIQANGLNNPNLIRINQQLRIPQAQPAGVANQGVTLLSGVNSKSDSSATGQEPQGVTAPNLSVPPLPERVTASQQQALPRPVLAQSTVVGSAKPNSSVVVDTRPSQSANSESNPYIEKLRADILRLREEYGHKKEGGQASASRNITVPTVTTPVASSLNNASTPPRINPEFNPKRHNETLQAELERRRQQQQVQKGPIQIEVPPPATASVPPPGLVAAAPAAADSYNPMIRTPVGQTVSPELPSLSAPDMYLPDSPAQFNGYIWPTKGVITSGYGRRWGRMHKGIDIAAPVGTPVLAAAPGVVVSAGWNSGGYGNLVEIQHPDGSLTLYAHNNRVLVRRGQQVAQGQQISEMGSTGRSTGPHCHFEVHAAGRGAVNPIAVLPRS